MCFGAVGAVSHGFVVCPWRCSQSCAPFCCASYNGATTNGCPAGWLRSKEVANVEHEGVYYSASFAARSFAVSPTTCSGGYGLDRCGTKPAVLFYIVGGSDFAKELVRRLGPGLPRDPPSKKTTNSVPPGGFLGISVGRSSISSVQARLTIWAEAALADSVTTIGRHRALMKALRSLWCRIARAWCSFHCADESNATDPCPRRVDDLP